MESGYIKDIQVKSSVTNTIGGIHYAAKCGRLNNVANGLWGDALSLRAGHRLTVSIQYRGESRVTAHSSLT